MKKLFLLALSCLLITVCLSQPADALGKLNVINNSKFALTGSITFYTALCKDDKIHIAGRGRWSVNSGLCKIKDSLFSLKDETGVSHVCHSTRGPVSQQNFVIYHRTSVPNAFCEVKNESTMY
jgi:hypothetical protein